MSQIGFSIHLLEVRLVWGGDRGEGIQPGGSLQKWKIILSRASASPLEAECPGLGHFGVILG